MAVADYTTLALVKAELNIPASDTTRDTQVSQKITAASRAIDKRCGRGFYKDAAPVARNVDVRGNVVRDYDGYRLLTRDIASETGLTTVCAGATLVGVETRPYNAIIDGKPITSLYIPFGGWQSMRQVSVTAIWGWPSVPDDIAEATILQACRYYRRKDSPEGVAGSAEWGLVRVPYLDPDVLAIIKDYRRPGIA